MEAKHLPEAKRPMMVLMQAGTSGKGLPACIKCRRELDQCLFPIIYHSARFWNGYPKQPVQMSNHQSMRGCILFEGKLYYGRRKNV